MGATRRTIVFTLADRIPPFVLGTLVLAAGCEDAPADARGAQIVSVIAAADEPFIRSRPALSAGKYTRMASNTFDFYRGTVPLFRHDMRSGTTAFAVSSFALDVPLVPSLGDPHPENFGALRARDGSLALEPNDFDASDRAPYLWDVRRLAAGMALAALMSNADDEEARARTAEARRSIARDAVAAYRAGIERAAGGRPPGRVTESENTIIADVFRRSARDHEERVELQELTLLEEGTRTLKRGAIDPAEPEGAFADLPPGFIEPLRAALERYRGTLVASPPAEHFAILDAVRVFGSGVASWPRVRVIVLVRGATDAPDDDVLLELKELTDSGLGGLYGAGVYHDDVGQRILETSRAAWARPDAEPWWGVTTWFGLPCQVRLESEGQKGIRVSRMTGDRGTPEALTTLGIVLGGIVARVHASAPNGGALARAVYKRISLDTERFLDEQADFGVAYADHVVSDRARFLATVHRVGLRLGIPFDPEDRPRPDLAGLFGSPPPPPPLPAMP